MYSSNYAKELNLRTNEKRVSALTAVVIFAAFAALCVYSYLRFMP